MTTLSKRMYPSDGPGKEPYSSGRRGTAEKRAARPRFSTRESTKGPWALVRGRSPHDPCLDPDGVSTFSVSYAAVGCCRDHRRRVRDNHGLVGSHGVPNFPDSAISVSSKGSSWRVPQGVNPNSPQFRLALQGCRDLLPPGASSGSSAPSQSYTSAVLKFAAETVPPGLD